MKKKSFITMMTGLFAFAAMAVSGALIINNSGLINFMAKAGTASSGSYTLTASDFTSGNGTATAGGETWIYENASISGSTVTITNVMYTSVRSGSTGSGGRRGNGYTRMVFTDLDMSSSSGLVFHETDVNGAVKLGGQTVSSDVDLTFSDTVDAANRRGVYFAQGASSSFSFTSLTMYYDCCDVTPEVEITTSSLSVSVGDTGTINASNSDVYSGDTVTYSWSSSDDSIATVSGNSLTGTVTGVAAGNADITITMNVNGTDYTDTLNITVIAAPATVTELTILDTSKIEGAGIFCRFNPSSASLSYTDIDGFGLTDKSLTFEDDSVVNSISSYTLQEKSDSSYTVYLSCASAVGLSGQFTVVADFKDNTNNIIYRATWHFDNGALATEISYILSSSAISVGDNATLTASNGFFVTGTTITYGFASSDTSVLTIDSVSDNVATLSGVASGSATVTITMTVDGVSYTKVTESITVASSFTYHDITFTSSTTIGGAGANLYIDNSDSVFATTDQSNTTVSLEFNGGTNFSGYETAMNNAGVSIQVYELTGTSLRIYGTMSNGFPDAGDFTHKFTVVISKGSDIYAGWVLITGNTTITSSGGYADVI